MILDVDESIKALVERELPDHADIDIAFDSPTTDWASRRNGPTIDIFLYDIREDLRREVAGRTETRDEPGRRHEVAPAEAVALRAYPSTAHRADDHANEEVEGNDPDRDAEIGDEVTRGGTECSGGRVFHMRASPRSCASPG